MNEKRLKRALEEITEELLSLDPEELRDELEKQTESDVYHLLEYAGLSLVNEIESSSLEEEPNQKEASFKKTLAETYQEDIVLEENERTSTLDSGVLVEYNEIAYPLFPENKEDDIDRYLIETYRSLIEIEETIENHIKIDQKTTAFTNFANTKTKKRSIYIYNSDKSINNMFYSEEEDIYARA